jgi:4-hydroxyphenylpyruvate dioxygenase
MTNYQRPTERPEGGKFFGFDHLHFYVSNAKQVASYYITRFGFEPLAYRGLETKSREIATHVVRQGKIILAFSCPLNPKASEIGNRVLITGDAVKDVAFTVEDCRALFAKAVKRGAKVIMEPVEEKDENGSVVLATVQTYGDTVHTFVQRAGYKGAFLPHYIPVTKPDPICRLLPLPNALFIDHVVGNQPDLKMEEAVNWYLKTLDFHRFWSVDDSMIHSKYSALRSVVVTDFDRNVKMPINEPAQGLRKSQIQEYVDYHGGAGVQHVALRTENIIETVTNLRSRGLEFLSVPKSYYDNVRERLKNSPVKVTESIDKLEELHILIDFDDKGYLLQLFTKPVEDRPTLFFEFIQRRNHEGFGAGNFKALFESIERDQELRGNLALSNPYGTVDDGKKSEVKESSAASNGHADNAKGEVEEEEEEKEAKKPKKTKGASKSAKGKKKQRT